MAARRLASNYLRSYEYMKKKNILFVVLAMLWCAFPKEACGQAGHSRFDSLCVEVMSVNGSLSSAEDGLMQIAMVALRGEDLPEAEKKAKAERLVKAYVKEQFLWDLSEKFAPALREKTNERELEEYAAALRKAAPVLVKIADFQKSTEMKTAMEEAMSGFVAILSGEAPPSEPKVGVVACSDSYKAVFEEYYELVLKESMEPIFNALSQLVTSLVPQGSGKQEKFDRAMKELPGVFHGLMRDMFVESLTEDELRLVLATEKLPAAKAMRESFAASLGEDAGGLMGFGMSLYGNFSKWLEQHGDL